MIISNVIRYIITIIVAALMLVPTAIYATITPKVETKVLKNQPKQMWNFVHADIRAVTQTISELTGKNIIIDPRVEGKITIVSQHPMTIHALFSSYISMLQMLNYTAVPVADNTLKIIPSADARAYATPDGKNISADQVVLRVIQIHNAAATSLIPVIRPLMHSWGYVTAYRAANCIILSGTKSNVERIAQLIAQMDKNNSNTINIIKLHYASAKKIAEIISSLQHKEQTLGKITRYSIMPDEGNNSILVSGSDADQKTMRDLIVKLDTSEANGAADTKVIMLKYLDAKDFAPILEKIAKTDLAKIQQSGKAKSATASSISVQAEENNNAIIVHAPATLMHTLQHVTKKLDHRPKQVLVEAIIVNMNQSLNNLFGIDWSYAAGATLNGTLTNGVGLIQAGKWTAIVKMLKSNADSNILATPSIMVLNNKTAEISSGENIAISSGSYSGSGTSSDSQGNSNNPYYQDGVYNSVDRKDITLKLDVTPHIAPNNSLRMHIEHQDDSLPNIEDDNTSTNLTRSFLTNTIKTDVLVNSGDVLVLGGLSQNTLSKSISKIPILGDIPGLGLLFQHTNKKMERKNLMVFIRPVIINSQATGRRETKRRYQNARAQELNMAAGVPLSARAMQMSLPSWRSQLPKGKYNKKNWVLPAPADTRPKKK